jgi:mRNA interferase RelE/StbE
LAFKICLTSSVQKYISKLDQPTRERFKKKLAEVENDPFNTANSEPLQGESRRKARVGGYRLLLEVDVANQVILVSSVGPRGQIYRA